MLSINDDRAAQTAIRELTVKNKILVPQREVSDEEARDGMNAFAEAMVAFATEYGLFMSDNYNELEEYTARDYKKPLQRNRLPYELFGFAGDADLAIEHIEEDALRFDTKLNQHEAFLAAGIREVNDMAQAEMLMDPAVTL